MDFSSLLSDHEQKAFSVFLGQLAQEERYKTHTPGGGDSILSQHQAQPRQSLAMPLSSSSSSLNGNFVRSLDSPSAHAQQQQRDWIQHISSNPLLAPGGIIDPHAMSQAFLQNPELMAQANAISQAMVLAQQQQMQLHLQQQQMRDQQQHQQQQHPPHHVSHEQAILQHPNNEGRHPYDSQRHYHQNSPPGLYSPEQQQQQQQQEYYHVSHDPSAQSYATHSRTLTKRKSQSNLHAGDTDGHDVTPPPLPLNTSVHHSAPASYSSSPNGYYEPGYALQSQHHSQEHEDGFGPPAKKATGRKGSSGNDSQRSSRDGHDPARTTGARRKTSGSSQHDGGGRRNDYYHMEGREDSEEVSFPGPAQEHRNGLHVSGSSGQISENETSSSPRHRQASSGEGHASRTRSPPSGQASQQQQQSRSSSKKAPHELLTEAEKKANHIASEQKRRQNIRIGFDSLVEIVPTLSECHRSEALILQKSVDYIHRLLSQKNELKSRVRDLQANLGEPTEDGDSASDMEIELYH